MDLTNMTATEVLALMTPTRVELRGADARRKQPKGTTVVPWRDPSLTRKQQLKFRRKMQRMR